MSPRRPACGSSCGGRHQVEPDPTEMATRYGAENTRARLARAPGLFPVRRPAGRHGADRDEAMILTPFGRNGGKNLTLGTCAGGRLGVGSCHPVRHGSPAEVVLASG